MKRGMVQTALRLLILQGSMNFERLQGIGAAVAIEPLIRDLEGGKGGAPLSEQRTVRLRPQRTHLECLELVRPFGTQLIVFDQTLNRPQKLGVLEHEYLCVENLGLGRACSVESTLFEYLEVLLDGPNGLVQPFYLLRHRILRHHLGRNIGQSPLHDIRRAHGNARRHADPGEEARVRH